MESLFTLSKGALMVVPSLARRRPVSIHDEVRRHQEQFAAPECRRRGPIINGVEEDD